MSILNIKQKIPYISFEILCALLSNPDRFEYIAERVADHNMSMDEASDKNVNKASVMAKQFVAEAEKLGLDMSDWEYFLEPSLRLLCALIKNSARYKQIVAKAESGVSNHSLTTTNIVMAFKLMQHQINYTYERDTPAKYANLSFEQLS